MTIKNSFKREWIGLDPKVLLGRKIIKIDLYPTMTDDKNNPKTIHPIIYFDNGLSLCFIVDGRVGPHGIDLIIKEE